MRANVRVNTCISYLSPGRSRTDAEISAASGHSFSTSSRGPHRDLLKPRKDFFTGKRRKQEKSDIADSQLTHKISASRLNKLNHKVGTKTGQNMETCESLRDVRPLNKLLSIVDNPSYPLHAPLQRQQSVVSLRLIQPRFRKMFPPSLQNHQA